MEISTLRNALEKQTKPHDFPLYNAGNLLQRPTKNFNSNQQIASQPLQSLSSARVRETPSSENFDINVQLRKLLIVSN